MQPAWSSGSTSLSRCIQIPWIVLELWNIHRNLWKNKYKKIPISKKCIFHQKIWNQLKRTWHNMKAETLKKPCVKFEEHRLNTLRGNRICQKVNLNVNQERAACPDVTYLITRFFLQKILLKTDRSEIENPQYGPRCEKTYLRGFANNTGADQPVHPRSLISSFDICFLERIKCKLATGKISIF